MIECIIFFILTLLLLKSSLSFIRSLSALLCVAFLCTQFYLAGDMIFGAANRSMMGRLSDFRVNETPIADEVEFDGNIYQITFDEYSSVFFYWAIRELSLLEEFKDFDFYANTRANYLATAMSVPSFMTGRQFKGKEPLKVWLDATPEKSLFTELDARGFRTTFYSPYNHAWYFPAHTVVNTPTSFLSLADVTLLRLVPTVLREEVFFEGQGLLSGLHEKIFSTPVGDSYLAYEQFKGLLDDEKKRDTRSEYVYAHFFLPHPPNSMSRDADYVPDTSDFMEETLLATNMMVQFIHTLKALGKYESSLIIFQSDHGSGWSTTLAANNIERTRPLLLVKRPDSNNKIIGDRRELVQLADLHPAILKQVSGPDSEQNNFMVRRDSVDIHHVYGNRKKGEGKTYRIGTDYFRGYMNWFKMNKDGVREDQERILVEW